MENTRIKLNEIRSEFNNADLASLSSTFPYAIPLLAAATFSFPPGSKGASSEPRVETGWLEHYQW